MQFNKYHTIAPLAHTYRKILLSELQKNLPSNSEKKLPSELQKKVPSELGKNLPSDFVKKVLAIYTMNNNLAVAPLVQS